MFKLHFVRNLNKIIYIHFYLYSMHIIIILIGA